MELDRQGRAAGRAFIEMEHEEDVRKALEKHRCYMGPRYLEGLMKTCILCRKTGVKCVRARN